MPDSHWILNRITAHAESAPDRIAVERGDRRVGYRELLSLVEGAGRDLRTGRFAVVERPRGVGLVVELLAALRTGRVYVPIDPALPAARRALIRERVREAGDGTDPDAAYVFFTSGSTGVPKPILGSRTGLTAFLQWQSATFGLVPEDRFAFLTAVGFDVSLRDMLLPLVSGATLVIPDDGEAGSPEATLGWLARRRITGVHVVPSVARNWLRFGRVTCPDLRLAFFAGEPLTADLLDAWGERFPGTRERVNLYGPTETTLAKFAKRLPAGAVVADPLPVGSPLPGTEVCLLDPAAALSPTALTGVPGRREGEIVIVTPHASHGYLGMAEETARRFVRLGDGRTGYRTGDLGRLTDDGELVVVGRTDDEVKINGVRVHPAEAAAAVRAHPRVADAFVVARAGRSGRRLVAYVVPAPGPAPAEATLRRDLARDLPTALVPARFVLLDALPTLPNGKVDRTALPEPERAAAEDEASGGEVAAWLAGQLASLLGLDRVGPGDDFFALGGDSLIATQLAGRVEAEYGVPLTMRTIMEYPSLGPLGKVIEHRRTGTPTPVAEPIVPLDRGAGRLPLSAAQRQLYFLQHLDPSSPAYNVAEAVRLCGRLDEHRVRSAVAAVVARHEVLRTLVVDGDDPYLVPFRGDIAFQTLDGTVETAADLLAREADRPFRLDTEPPLRVTLLRLGEHEHEHVLLFVVHHLATDAWSSRLLVDEFAAAYAGRTTEVPVLQYADVAAGPPTAADDARIEYQLRYWRERLAGAPPVLELPLDRPRPPVRDDAGAELAFTVDPATTALLRRVAAHACATPYLLLFTAFAYVLGRHCGADDLVVGTPVAGRRRPETEALIGCFINTLAVRVEPAGTATVRQLLARVGDAVLGAFEHQEVPFPRLVAELAPERDPGLTPLVQVLFNHYPAAAARELAPGLRLTPQSIPRSRAKFDLTCTFKDHGDRLEGTLTYATAVFTEAHIARLAGHLGAVLRLLPVDLDRPLRELPAVPREDLPSVTSGGHRTAAPAAAEPPLLVTLVERHAAERPDHPAVVFAGATTTYGELNARANRLARHLRARGIGPADRVALLLERSTDGVVAMLAVQKTGAAYVPLDPAFPQQHLDRVLQQAGAKLVLTHDELGPALAHGDDDADLGEPIDRAAAMYVLFTSGSTGLPKGVVVEHGNVAAYLAGLLARLELPGGLSFALLTTFAADLGLTNVYGALATGGTLHVLPYATATDPEELAGYFRRHRIDVVKTVPSHLNAMREAGVLADVVPQRILVLAGEACPWDLVDSVRAVRPDCAVWNHYGPTETTVSVLAYEVPAEPPSPPVPVVPLGTPLAHARVYVVDRDLRPVPVGTPGELLIAGAQVARGYLGEHVRRDGPDADRFVEDPFGRGRAYRSGDRVRLREDGTVEFLGRLDRQVKIRGYRVEPGAIEAALRRLPNVGDAAVVVREGPAGPVLVAYYTRTGGAHGADRDIADALRVELPPYQVPAGFVALDRLPITPNGKLDRRALPPWEPTAAPAGPAAAPRDARDAELAALWAEVLGRPSVGIDDNFFDLGGDSLTAMRLVRRIGRGLRTVSLFQFPTVRGLADHVAEAEAGGAAKDRDGLLCRLTPPPTGRVTATVVAVPFGGGTATVFHDLAQALPGDYQLVAVEPPGHDPSRPDQPLLDFETLVERCVAQIRRDITGPVLVYGHCLGAAAAAEIADRLDRQGVRVLGAVLGGAFPSPRLPGRVFDRIARVVPADRFTSDRVYRDTLRAIGGLTEELSRAEQGLILRALRHDARQAEEYYSRRCRAGGPPSRVPALAVVGEHDRLTEFHDERFHEWDLLCAGTELAVVPGAGHYFLRHQAGYLADTLVRWCRQRAADPGTRPSGTRKNERKSGLRSFALVAGGQFLSMIGSRVTAFGLGVWSYLDTHNATQFAFITICAFLPGLLALPFAGAAVDRWDRRKVLLGSDVIGGLGTVLLLGLWTTGALQLWHLYVAASLFSVAASVQQPAFVAATAQLVPKRYLSRTNGVTNALIAVTQLTGPLLGGALIVGGGLGGILGTDLVSFAVSIVVLLSVRFPDRLFRRREESAWREITGGLRYIARRRSFVAMVVYFLGYNLLLGFATILIPTMVLAGNSPQTLGWATACAGLGGVVGGLVMALWGGFARRATGMIGFCAVTGAGMMVAGWHPGPVFPCVGLALIAGSLSLLNGHWQTLIQIKVGAELQGRVIAVNRTVATLSEPVGYFFGGWLADRYLEPAMRPGGALSHVAGGVLGTGPGRGMALLVVSLGAVQVLLTAAGLRWRTLHRMEDVLPDAIPGPVVTFDRDRLQAEADSRLTLVHDTRPELVDAVR